MTDRDASTADRGRFRKGRSGNPGGRPKAAREPAATSAFAIVIERTLTLTRDGLPAEISVEEALQQKTYQDALAGKRLAMRQVLRWIERREEWHAEHGVRAAPPRVTRSIEQDPDNADEALLVLGIADHDASRHRPEGERAQLLLEPWAVEAALRRRGLAKRLSLQDKAEVRRCTRGAARAAPGLEGDER